MEQVIAFVLIGLPISLGLTALFYGWWKCGSW
jgi:hypothetical protein